MASLNRISTLFAMHRSKLILYSTAGLIFGSGIYRYNLVQCQANKAIPSRVGICKEHDLIPFEAPHGEVIEEIFGNAAGGTTEHSLARCRIPFGKKALIHYHPIVEESYYILDGEGTMNYCPVLEEHLKL